MTPCASLAKVLKADTCSGCGACAALAPGAIAIALDDDGFNRPRQVADVSAKAEADIAAVCPGLVIDQVSKEGSDHVLWGPIIQCRVGHSTDSDLRHHASSGGGISGLLLHLLQTKQVDRVVHVAASTASPIENMTVISHGRDGIYAGAGSRYAPSSPLAELQEHLRQPGRFALVGKPCDIAAARAMTRRDPVLSDKIPFMLSFFCAGVPSRRGTELILKKLGVEERDVSTFKYRGDGWPGFATAVKKSGEAVRMSYADSWGSILSKHVQARCKICPDGSGGFADVVCADAWESDEEGYPKFAELDGQSLILSRTAKGEALVQQAMASGAIKAASLDTARIAVMQPSQARRKRLVLSRLLAMRTVLTSVPVYHGLQLTRAARQAGVPANIKSFLGMLRRLVIR